MLINILLLMLIAAQVVIGLRLLDTGRKNHLPNLIWLAAAAILAGTSTLFAPTDGNLLGNFPFSIWVFVGGTVVSLAGVILFNQLTFYTDRKSPVLWVWIMFAVTLLLSFYGVAISQSNYNQSGWVSAYIPATIVVWAWHGWAARQALNQMETEPSLQHWIKTRYRLIVVYAAAFVIAGLGSFVRIVFSGGSSDSLIGSLSGIITLLAEILSAALMFLVWVMPERFRLWINHNQKAQAEQQVADQASAILNMLGAAMSDGNKLSKTLALVVIRKTIGQEINTNDSKAIEAHVVQLGYHQWYDFLNDPNLDKFIREIANVNAQDILSRAKYTLRENQSLFTLQTK